MDWENGEWRMFKYTNKKPFFLKTINDELTEETVSEAMNTGNYAIKCFRDTQGVHSCLDGTSKTYLASGNFLFFNPKTLSGSTSTVLGSISNAQKRDSVITSIFTCQKCRTITRTCNWST